MNNNPVGIKRVKDGWTYYSGQGWAVYAETKAAVIREYKKRLKFYQELEKRPLWCFNPENPNRITQKQYDEMWGRR